MIFLTLREQLPALSDCDLVRHLETVVDEDELVWHLLALCSCKVTPF